MTKSNEVSTLLLRCSEHDARGRSSPPHPGRRELQREHSSWLAHHTHACCMLQRTARLAQPWLLLAARWARLLASRADLQGEERAGN